MTEKNSKYESPGKSGLKFFRNYVDTNSVVMFNGLTQTDTNKRD